MNKPENILIDTGFWIALYNERDRYHNDALEIIELIADSNLILPWPTLYETINTRLSKNTTGISNFEEIIRRPNSKLFNDLEYRVIALEKSIKNSKTKKRPMSLVDSIIRELLADINIKIDYLITFNIKDFQDLCYLRNIELISGCN